MQLIVWSATVLFAMAALLQLAVPVTPEVARFSPFLKPLMVASKAGLASPYWRDLSSAVTVSTAFVTCSVPGAKNVKL